MAAKPEEIGVLVVHGMGEQRPLEHLRATAKEIASFIAQAPGMIRLDISDETAAPSQSIRIEAVLKAATGTARRSVRLQLHEVWWADLGIKRGLMAQIRFWLWGLGQWAAEIVFKGDPRRNTTQLMAMPSFGYQETPMDPPGLWHRVPSRLALLAAGLLAVLTFFSWSIAKRIISWLSQRLPDPILIFLFLGDVKIYQDPGGPGRGTLEDADLPVRTTIRRRMVSKMMAMATSPYDRWYILAHSLGSVAAFNALQETELALPNYLSELEWQSVPIPFKTRKPFKPPGAKPSTDAMMPRRPPWLGVDDGIDRKRLFERFAGMVTYGSPLDKFAALWPRIVCLNRQAAVFSNGAEWVNLYDPTDPVGARLDAFGPPKKRADQNGPAYFDLVPRNFAARSSRVVGLSHIRYLSPRKRAPQVMAAAIVDALIGPRGTRLGSSAPAAAIKPPQYWLRLVSAVLQGLLLGGLLAGIAAILFNALGDILFWDHPPCPALFDWRDHDCWAMLVPGAGSMVLAALVIVLIAGVVRATGEYLFPHKH